jgi:type I restriction enzyme M protein
VGSEEKEEDMEEFNEKIQRLTSELSEQFKRSRELEDEIRKNMEKIGFLL